MADIFDADRLLPVGSVGERSGGWWGMLTLIATEASLFAYLIFSYLYLASQTTQHWPPEGLPKLGTGSAGTAVLITSSVFVWLAQRRVMRQHLRAAVIYLVISLVLGVAFAGMQLHEWAGHPYGPSTHLYGSLYFTMTGFHLLHVVVGLFVLLLLLIWTASGYFDERRCAAFKIGALYWHFVDVVWLFIFTTIYLTPYWF